MKRISLLSFLFLIEMMSSVWAAPAARPAPAPSKQLGIAATVNDDIITTRDVEGRVNMALQGAQMRPTPEILKELQHQALEALIDEQIRLQEASRIGGMPSKEEVDVSFAKVAEQNRLQPEQFKAALGKMPGVYESLRHQLQTQLAWSNVVKKKIRPQVNITENDITSYLAEKEKNVAKTEYQVAEIFLKNSESNKQLAGKLIEQLKSGKQRFSVLARQFSQGLEAGKGGLLGWIPEGRLEPVLDKAIQATPVGHISDVTVSERGLHIFLIRDKRAILAMKESSQRIQLKQVVIPIPSQAPDQYIDKAMQQAKIWQAEAKNCAAMDELIKKINSPLSRDLGMVRLADLPAPVVKIVKDLPLEKASEPTRATDGLITLMVCKREEGTDESVRDDIANQLGTERLNRLQYRYYRDLRSGAYVDIKQN